MRLSRVIPLLMAIILAATLSQALVSPSQAIPSAAHKAMKPRHDLQAAGTEVGNTNHFVIYGSVTGKKQVR